MPILDDYLSAMIEMDGSDLHLCVGLPPKVRIHGTLEELDEPAVGAEKMEEMIKMLPEGMVNALGMDQVGTTLLTFLSGYMYGFLLLLFPMVISIVVNHGLIASCECQVILGKKCSLIFLIYIMLGLGVF